MATPYIKRGERHEHRIVAEIKLGRPLMPGEIVHHIDGNTRNNDPANLEVMTQAEHARIHNTGSKHPWKTCKNGHEWTNPIVVKAGWRRCRTCELAYQRVYQAAARAKARAARQQTISPEI